MKQRIIGISETRVKFDMVESSEVDNVHVLAKVRGRFFVPNGRSRNGRFYPEALWQKVVTNPAIISKLEDRAVYGSVGHEQKIDDDAVKNGNISHIVTKLFIQNGEGLGEALILNTEAGRNLNTILRAGGRMFVSTRANGSFKGKTTDNLPIVNPDDFEFETVDFVLEPGFLEANPSLVESYNNLTKNTLSEENKDGEKMSEKLLEMLTNESADLKLTVKTLTADVKALSEANSELMSDNKHLTEQLAKLEEANKKIAELEDEKADLEKGKKDAEDKIAEYEEIGDSPEDVKESLKSALSLIKKVNEDLGGYAQAKKALELAIEFRESVDAHGGLNALIEAKKKVKEMEDEKEAEEKEKEAEEVAEALNISVEKAKSLLENSSKESVLSLYASLKESKATSKYKKNIFEGKKKKGKNEEGEEEEEVAPSVDEEEDEEDKELSESKILKQRKIRPISL